MIAIGRYFVFTISVMATILSAHDINDNDLKEFLLKIKFLHNKHRSLHMVPNLDLDEDLSKTANTILNKLHDKKTKIDPQEIGVNIGHALLKNDSKLDDEEAAQLFAAWYDTGAEYAYGKKPSKKMAIKAAPFTQIVWKNTTKIGLAMSVDPGFYDIVVTYSPQGNIKDEYENNVFKPNE